MSANLDKFHAWFSDPLEFFQHKKPLERKERQDGFDGAFLAMSLGLFLFERYYRIKSGTHDVEPDPNNTGKNWDAEFKKYASADLNIDLDFITAFWAVFKGGGGHILTRDSASLGQASGVWLANRRPEKSRASSLPPGRDRPLD